MDEGLFCRGEFRNFNKFITHSLALDPELKKKLAKQFEVAESTVGRWAKGAARPHPRIQRQVIQFILREQGKYFAYFYLSGSENSISSLSANKNWGLGKLK